MCCSFVLYESEFSPKNHLALSRQERRLPRARSAENATHHDQDSLALFKDVVRANSSRCETAGDHQKQGCLISRSRLSAGRASPAFRSSVHHGTLQRAFAISTHDLYTTTATHNYAVLLTCFEGDRRRRGRQANFGCLRMPPGHATVAERAGGEHCRMCW